MPRRLPELDEAVRDQVLEAMPNEQVAEALQQLDSDDAVYVIEDLDKEEQSDILAKLPSFERAALERSLEYPEDSAGRIMQTDFIAVPPFWSVGQTIDYMREAEDLPDRFYEVFVVDPAYHLIGSVALDRLLRSKRPIDHRDHHRQRYPSDRRSKPTRRRWRASSSATISPRRRWSMPDRQAGRRDHRRRRGRGDPGGGVGGYSALGGVAGEVGLRPGAGKRPSIASSGCSSISARRSSPRSVISLFDATIQQMVALAVLMPIVASMGGNAGTQTMTVAVRALATQDLGAVNARASSAARPAVGVCSTGFCSR